MLNGYIEICCKKLWTVRQKLAWLYIKKMNIDFRLYTYVHIYLYMKYLRYFVRFVTG